MLQTANIEQPALQRARGAVDLVVKAGKLERFYQSGSAKIFLPKTYAQTIEAVLVNTAGGLTGGDEFGVRLGAEGDTHLTVSTQTAARQTKDFYHEKSPKIHVKINHPVVARSFYSTYTGGCTSPKHSVYYSGRSERERS